MLSCKEATRLISDRQDRHLPMGRRLALGMHLLMCHLCRKYARHLAFLQRAGRQLDHHIEQHGETLPAQSREQIKKVIDNHS